MQTANSHKHRTCHELHSHVWAQTLAVGFWGSEEKGPLPQPPGDRPSHPGTSTHSDIACQGGIFHCLCLGSFCSCLRFFNPIRATLSCVCYNHAQIARHKIFINSGKPISLKRGHLGVSPNSLTFPERLGSFSDKTPLSTPFPNRSHSFTLGKILGAIWCP